MIHSEMNEADVGLRRLLSSSLVGDEKTFLHSGIELRAHPFELDLPTGSQGNWPATVLLRPTDTTGEDFGAFCFMLSQQISFGQAALYLRIIAVTSPTPAARSALYYEVGMGLPNWKDRPAEVRHVSICAVPRETGPGERVNRDLAFVFAFLSGYYNVEPVRVEFFESENHDRADT